MTRPRRPLGVTVVAALGLVQGVLLVALGALFVAGRDEPDVRDSFEATATALVVAGAVVAALGLLSAVFAVLLARGSELARTVVGVVNTVEVAAAVYSLVALRDLRVGSVWALAFPVAVLWLLYGSEETRGYFAP